MKSITPTQLQKLQDQGRQICLVDLRQINDFDTGHIPGAIHLDFRKANFTKFLQQNIISANNPLILYCAVGAHSKVVYNRLVAAGCEHVYNLTGGITLWLNEGFSTEEKGQIVDHPVADEIGYAGSVAVAAPPSKHVARSSKRATNAVGQAVDNVVDHDRERVVDQGFEYQTDAESIFISPREVGCLMKADLAIVIDVRTPMEYREMHIRDSHNVPLHRLEAVNVQAVQQQQPGVKILLVCKNGYRTKKAYDKLTHAGLRDISLIEGGIDRWIQEDLPLVYGKKGVSIERQVRFAAGFLVALGVILSLTVHSYAVGLSLFVGCGLMFAGITDTCGMAVVLARMPWNQLKNSTQAKSSSSSCSVDGGC